MLLRCATVDLLYSFAPQSDGNPICTGQSKPALFLSETSETSVPFTYSVTWTVCHCYCLSAILVDISNRNHRRRGYEITTYTSFNPFLKLS